MGVVEDEGEREMGDLIKETKDDVLQRQLLDAKLPSSSRVPMEWYGNCRVTTSHDSLRD